RNRFYHIALNRFLQPDPIGFAGDTTNLYRHCGNNPVNATDPSGLDYDHDGRGDEDTRGSSLFDDPIFSGNNEWALPSDSVKIWGITESQLFSIQTAARAAEYQEEKFSMGFTSGDAPDIRRARPVHNIAVFYPKLN